MKSSVPSSLVYLILFCASTSIRLLGRKGVMVLDVEGLPRVTDPHIFNCSCCVVSIPGQHVVGQGALLWLVLVVEYEDAELGLSLHTELLSCGLDVLLQLLDGILERSPGVVDLINDEDTLANEVLHAAQTTEVKPLCAGDGVANLLNSTGCGSTALGVCLGKLFVQGEADSLDGNVGRSGSLEEGSKDSCGNVTTATNGNHKVRVKGLEDLDGTLLTERVHLQSRCVSLGVWNSVVLRRFSRYPCCLADKTTTRSIGRIPFRDAMRCDATG